MTESSEEEALFRSCQYTALYFVQSPTTTVSFHSPTTQRRLTLSHYSSSRGSSNSMHDKKLISRESPEHETVVKHGEKRVESEEEDGEEEGVGREKKMWDFVSFSRSDSCVWITFQISLRLMISFGVALFFFYFITKPPHPVLSLKEILIAKMGSRSEEENKWFLGDLPFQMANYMGLLSYVRFCLIERVNEFRLAEGADNTGVTTKFLTCNCSINLLVNIKSRLYGLHIHPMVLTMSFDDIPFVTLIENQALYASSDGPTSFLLYLGTTNKPMYGAGRSMQDILDSGKGLSLVVHVKFSSRFYVVGKLIRLKYHHHAECILIINRSQNKQHKTLIYDNRCKFL